MRKVLAITAFCVVGLLMFSQAVGFDTWTVGKIVEVKVCPGARSVDADSLAYHVSIKAGQTVYIVLYTAPPGRMGLPFRVGRDLPVLVRGNILTFADVQGNLQQAPILSTRNPRPSDLSIK